MTAELDVVAYLQSKGITTWRAAGSEVTAHCIWGCSGSATKGKGKWYINTETWLSQCKVCGASHNRRTLLEHFGDEDEVRQVGAADPMLRRTILDQAATLASEMLLVNERQIEYLTETRGISAELIVSHRIGYVPRNTGLSDMLPIRQELQGYQALITAGLVLPNGREWANGSILIPYASHGSVVALRCRDEDGKYRTAGGDVARLFNADSLFGADEVLIVEGEMDCLRILTAIQSSSERSLTGLAVVAVPGAFSWPDGLIDMLGDARKVFIGFDADDTGRKAAAKLGEAVGARARVVALPVEGDDWTDWLNKGHGWRDIRDLLVEADLAGKQMFTARDLAAKWLRRRTEAPGLQLGWTSIDAVIRPGLKAGQVMIPLAQTGVGKTVFLNNVAHNMQRQHKGVLFVSLEMTGAEVWEHLRRIHRFWNPSADLEQMFCDYGRLAVTERNRIGAGDLQELVAEYAEEFTAKPDLIIVDYLQYYARGFRGGSMHERVSDAIMELKAVAKEVDAAVIVPSQVNRTSERGKPLTLDSSRDSGVIEETGDFVLSLYRPDQLEQADGTPLPQDGNVNAQLLKSRHGGVGKTFQLRMSLMSLAITDRTFDQINSARVEQENAAYRRGMHYEDLRASQDAEIAQGALSI